MAGIALGIVVFGDRIQISPGMLAIEAGGIAALIVGVVAVARSSAFSGLRKIPTSSPRTAKPTHEAHHLGPPPDAPHTTPAAPGGRHPDLNGRAGPDLDGRPPGSDLASRPGPPPRMHRRPFQGPASGEEGG